MFFVSMITTAKSRHAEPENRSEKHSSKTVERRTGLQAEQKKTESRVRDETDTAFFRFYRRAKIIR